MQQIVHPPPQAGPATRQLIYNGNNRKWQNRPVNGLMSLESSQNYTWLFWKNGERMLLPRTLKYVEGKLPPEQFIRLRRDFTANIDYIVHTETNKYGGLMVRLQNGDRVAVARRRIVQVRRQLSLLLH